MNYFFINPHEELYINELARKMDLDKRNLVKKLRQLEKDGILKHKIRGNLRLYSINKEYPLYNEYKNIILKTVGLEEKLKRVIKEVPGVKRFYIYGSYAENKMDTHSDIDLLVIGNHKIVPLQRKLSKLQSETDREINSVNMDEIEFEKRKKNRDPFILDVLKKKHIEIVV